MGKNIGSVNILGISAYYHDSAACLVRDGEIIAAAQEERFTRKKHDHRFPSQAIAYCLKEGGLMAQELDYVAFYDKPLIKFERLLETYLTYAPIGFKSFLMAMPLWLKQKLFMRDTIAREMGYKGMILFPEHHESQSLQRRRYFDSGWGRGMGYQFDGSGARQSRRAAIRNTLPAFAGPSLFRFYVLYRLQGQFGRIQGHGVGALRRAQICGYHPQ